MNDNTYALIKQRAAQLMPASAPALGLAAVGLRIAVDEMADAPRLDTTELPPTLVVSKADYRDLILRLRAEP